MSLSTAAEELRCPATLAKFDRVCNRRLGRFQPGAVGFVELHCHRCDTVTIFALGSSMSESSGGRTL